MIPATVIESVRPASAASKVRDLLKSRDRAEAEIAAILRHQLDQLGEKNWLVWCEAEFGWKRTSAYRHLDPLGQRKHRETAHVAPQRPHGGDIEEPAGAGESEEEPEEVEETPPKDHYNAFLLRAEQSISFALNCGRLTLSRSYRAKAIEKARAAAEAWTKLADTLESK